MIWRHIAIGYSSLWSHIPFHNIEWAKQMLEWLRDVPLDVIIREGDFTSHACTPIINTLLMTDRLRRVSFNNVSDTPMHQCIPLLKTLAPKLQVLTLSIGSGSNRSYIIPESLFYYPRFEVFDSNKMWH